MMEKPARELIEDFLDAENRRDWQEWESCLANSVCYQVVGSDRVFQGKQAYLEKIKRTYSELSDWKFEIVNLLSNQDVVVVEFDGSGHFSGPYDGHQYDGVPLQLEAVCIFRIAEGLIAQVKEYWDPAGFERQLKNRTDAAQENAR